jgi:hypothetical protein
MSMDVSVILRLVDQLSGPAKQAANSLRQLVIATNELRKGGGLELLPKQIRDASAGMRALQADVRAMTSSFRAASDSARGMSRELKGSSAQSGFRAQVANLRQMVSLQNQLIRNQGRLNAAPAAGGRTLGRYGGLYAFGAGAHRIGHGLAVGLGQAGALQAEMSYLDVLGIDPAQKKRIIEEARRTTGVVPNVTTAETLHTFRELRYAFANENHAIESMADMAKFQTSLSALVSDKSKAGQLREQTYEMVKSAELRNQIKSPAEFRRFQDMILAAAHSSGGIVDPSSIFQAFKYSRGALHAYDEDFTRLFLPEIVQELQTGRGGGGRGGAGTSLAAFKRMFVDQTFALKYVPQMLKAGLIDPNKVIYGRRGKIEGLSPGAFYDQDIAARNPFEYMSRRIKPALERLGVKDFANHAAIVQAIAGLGGTEIAKQLLQIMVIQEKQMKNRAEMTKKVAGVDKTYETVWNNYNSSLERMKKQFEDMNAAVLKPLLPTITLFQNALTNAMSSMKRVAEYLEKPLEVAGPGLLGAGLFGAGWLAKRMLLRGAAGLGGRMLLGAGLGALVGGPSGALIGGSLASALGKIGTAATEAATSATSAAGNVGSLAKSLGALGNPLTAALGILEGAVWLRKNTDLLNPAPGGELNPGADRKYNAALREHFAEERRRQGVMAMGADVYGWNPATGMPAWAKEPGGSVTDKGFFQQMLEGPATMMGSQAGNGFKSSMTPYIEGFGQQLKSAANVDLSSEGANAGRSFGQAFLQSALEYIRRIGQSTPQPGGAVTPGPDGYLGDYNR